MHLTRSGRLDDRRWFWYCALNLTLGDDPGWPVELSTQPDPDWRFYRDLLKVTGL
jgi:hypothetical protein